MKLLLLLLKLLLHARLVLLAMVATGCCAVPTRQEGRQDERDHQREARTEHRYDVNPRSCEKANTVVRRVDRWRQAVTVTPSVPATGDRQLR